ncbi:hypothetical protein GKZ68_18245 [Hymenobacter sp. BRD128]|uniref:hypothetical protein n=1 Tax=Hymenobacter sp. BRD128 TaxID=2675878 RepID=UPI0015666CA5|nr:hypothetical protein [Hymenobacter sp. BRD128]QKG58399.1 hypothetical protein GKZ68_18245 [Hymenobacter sp. BRD128]
MKWQIYFAIDTILHVGYIILAATAVIGIARFKKLPSNLRYLLVLVGFEAVTELAGNILYAQHRPNLLIYPIFSAGEFWLLALIYDKALKSPAFSLVRPWLAGSFVAYCALDSLFAPEAVHFKPTLQLVESLLILGLVGLFFRKLLNELRISRLDREPMFWVSVGLVINHLGNIQILLFSNFLLSHYSKQLNMNIWAIHALLLMVLYSCYCVALWIRPRN